jgi:hypothetical protein
MPKTIAAHINDVMKQLDRVKYLEGEERTRAMNNLCELFKQIRAGHMIVAPLYPREDKLTPIVENYRKCLAPKDILDDDSGPFHYKFSGK